MPVIADLSLTITPATALYTAPVNDGIINAYETVNEGRHAIVLDFNAGAGIYARDLGTIFQWPTTVGTILYVWQPSIIPQPESIYGRATDWNEGGGSGAKFVQGVMVTANSFGNPKTFFLQDFAERPVAQPWPELCFNWQTEQTSLGMIGWGHVREMNVPYVSTTPITLVLTFDAWPTITIPLPSTAGVQNKTKVTLPPNKFKLIGLQTFSTSAGHRVFADDLQLKIGQWGRTESYQVLRPFGGPSRTGAVV